MGKIMINDINFSGGGPQIDDTTTSNSTTWSSNQTNTEITKVAHNSADEYDSTRTSSNKYNKGDLCIYQNTLYKCNADGGTYGPFDSSKWDATTVADQLALKQNVTDNSLQTTSKTVAGAINEVKLGMIGQYTTEVIKFGNLTWTQSASGMYYATIDLDNIIPSGKTIIGVTIQGWNNIRSTDFVIPYIRTSRTIGIMSNVNSFANVNTGYGYSILYV